MWTARRHQKQCPCTAICLPVHSHSGYHPQFIATTSMEKKKKKQLRVCVVKWLGFGHRWCWKLSEWELGLTSTVQRQPLICWIASVQKRFAYAALSLFLRHETRRSRPPQAPLWPPPGKLWFSAKSIQCCIVQVLHSALKKHAYRGWVGSTLSYSTILICAEFSVCSQQDGPVPGMCLRHPEGHPVPQHNRIIYFRGLICISLKCRHFLSLL